jgi:hypothetical protein
MNKLQKIAVVSTLVATIAAALPSFAQENCDATIDHYALGNEQYAAGDVGKRPSELQLRYHA